MKKILLIILLIFLLAGCTENNTDLLNPIDVNTSVDKINLKHEKEICVNLPTDLLNPIDVNTLVDEINLKHEKEVCVNLPTGLNKYCVDNDKVKLFSDEEIKNILDSSRKIKESITKEEALEDAKLLNDLFVTSYGPYYYFGEEKFSLAYNSLEKWINAQPYSIKTQDLINRIFYEDYKFVFYNDRHSRLNNLYYKTNIYYTDLLLSKDNNSNNYFTYFNNRKYYLDENCLAGYNYYILPRINGEGNLFYSIIIQSDTVINRNISLSFFNSDNIFEKNYLITNYKHNNLKEEIYKLNLGKTLYYRIGTFNESEESQTKLKELSNLSEEDLNSSTIIFDLRRNTGGNCTIFEQWFYNYFNENVSVPRFYAIRKSQLTNNSKSKNCYGISSTYNNPSGKFIKNPKANIIVLVDDAVASSGEQFLRDLKSIENCAVIGTHTSGCSLGGNVKNYYLKNSNIKVALSSGIKFIYEGSNIDPIGIQPDIWSENIENTLLFLKNNGFINSENYIELKNNIK